MNKYILIIISLICSLGVQAQNRKFLEGLRSSEAGKGTVTVTQSAEIDRLVNGNMQSQPQQQNQVQQPVRNQQTQTQQPVRNQQAQNQPQSQPQQPRTATKEETPKPEANNRAGQDIAHNNHTEAPMENTYVDTSKKVMRNSYKTTGYRIQVFSGGNSRNDRQKAERAGSDMKRMFPTEPVYVHFYSPSWKCRMGNYRDIQEARRVLAQVKKYYPQACLVKGTISVQY